MKENATVAYNNAANKLSSLWYGGEGDQGKSATPQPE